MSERQARVSNDGCGIFLTGDELRTLGVDPEVTDAVEYDVTESGLVVTDPKGGEE
ncbi:hypothetical protein J2751_002050 [Halorubrum alkaliphilum]|uniref:Uncharacterized protein n=1 Tax=Halorubrum alkaliphilum TaxID=261290 RepID=A0A8T4GH12_9EURY|nr:hypothetical protein [Halorubrum alkaliphilum]MBP1923017.1 hypothetical protein [Halorubrum alkaliphilum]